MNETSLIVTPSLAALQAMPNVVAYRIFSGQARVRGGMIHGAPNGTPDIGAVIRGRAHFFEAKVDDRLLNPDQVRMREMLLRAGAEWHLVRSVKDTIDAMREAINGK